MAAEAKPVKINWARLFSLIDDPEKMKDYPPKPVPPRAYKWNE